MPTEPRWFSGHAGKSPFPCPGGQPRLHMEFVMNENEHQIEKTNNRSICNRVWHEIVRLQTGVGSNAMRQNAPWLTEFKLAVGS